jgi:hypothetical protein
MGPVGGPFSPVEVWGRSGGRSAVSVWGECGLVVRVYALTPPPLKTGRTKSNFLYTYRKFFGPPKNGFAVRLTSWQAVHVATCDLLSEGFWFFIDKGAKNGENTYFLL